MENPNVESRAIMSQAKAIKDFNFLTDSITISNYLGGYTMRKLKEKQCKNCGTNYTPTGSCSKYCILCTPEMRRQLANKGQQEYRRRQGKQVGGGSGCTTGKGKDNHMWKNGMSVFSNNRAKIKLERRYCEDCGKDMLEATHYQWVIHHIDHNRYNNPEDGSNWKLLCKKCHQIEHKCWLALEGATTSLIRLPNGRYARDERSPQESGEAQDILSSVR